MKILERVIWRRQQWMEKLQKKWQDLGVEAVICPPFPSCAFKNENSHLAGLYDYTILWNLTNFPSGSVPVTEVLPGEEESNYEDGYNDVFTHILRKDLKGSAGMPLGVQVVSWAFEDEVCLAVMKAIDDQCQYNKAPLH